MNFQFPKYVGNFLTSWGTVTFSGRTVLHGVSLLFSDGPLIRQYGITIYSYTRIQLHYCIEVYKETKQPFWISQQPVAWTLCNLAASQRRPFLRMREKQLSSGASQSAVRRRWLSLYICTYKCGPGSSVSIATDYGLGSPGPNPGEDEIFRPSRPALGPTQPPVQWVPWGKCGRGVLLTTHPLLVLRSTKSRAKPLPNPWATPGL